MDMIVAGLQGSLGTAFWHLRQWAEREATVLGSELSHIPPLVSHALAG